MEPSVETNGQKAARERLDVPSQASIGKLFCFSSRHQKLGSWYIQLNYF